MSLGYELDEWQAWCLDGLFSEDARFRLCASVVLIILPRQNGKNVVLEVAELYAFYVLEWPIIIHTAHRQDTSADHMARLRAVIEANDDLDSITEVREANGKERIVRTDTRAEIRFYTRSKKIGRGRSPRMVVFDEALYLTDEQIQAIIPSMSAQTMLDDAPLMVYASSAPVPESEVLHRIRKACIAGLDQAFFAEWSCEDDVDPNDRDAWYAANPGMGVRISEDWVAENELALLSPAAFLTERLGVCVDEGLSGLVIPIVAWQQCFDPDSRLVGKPVIALDVNPERTQAAFAAAGSRADGLVHVEVIRSAPGTGWVVEEAKTLATVHEVPILLDPSSPAGGLLGELVKAGVPVVEVKPRAHAQACGALLDAVQNQTLRHIGQGSLLTALTGARKRHTGDAWMWSRIASNVDISPLVAVTLAHGAVVPVVHESFAIVL